MNDAAQMTCMTMAAAGVTFHAPPGPPGGMRATYGRDPEGNVFELIQFDGDHSFAFDRLGTELIGIS